MASLFGGIAFGGFILWAEHELTYPWEILGGSAALWGVAAFAVGLLAARALAGATYGAVTLIVGLLTFYVAAALFVNNTITNVWSEDAVFWYIAGVVIGALAGLAGAWASYARAGWTPVVGWAFPVALLWSEGLVRSSNHGVGTGPGPAYLLGIFGVVVLAAAVVHLGRRDLKMMPAVLAVAVVLTLVGYVLYRAVGIRHAP